MHGFSLAENVPKRHPCRAKALPYISFYTISSIVIHYIKKIGSANQDF